MDARIEVGGRYRIEGELGRGGMGVVYRAHDLLLARPVALKRPRDLGPEQRERARREALALELLRVPGVVELVDVGQDEQGPYLVTELVDGAPFPGDTPVSLIGLATQLLKTLVCVHEAGIVHRDLKPGNVLVDRNGRVWLLDFGVARGEALGATVTSAAGIVGTPRYLAPEQIAGSPATTTSDLYAVGLMLCEALTGDGPFNEHRDPNAIFSRITKDPPPLLPRAPDAPLELVFLTEQLLARRPPDRPGSAMAALQILAGRRTPAELRLVGRAKELEALLAAARAGRALGITAATGMGRTRLLSEVMRCLVSEGLDVAFLPREDRPLLSLRRWLGLGDDAVPSECIDRARARLANGAVLLVDDGADRWSTQLLCTLAGAVIGNGEGLPLGPLKADELRGLLRGPDKVLHLRGDGASELHRRSGGIPGRMVATVHEWVVRGLARVADGFVHLEPGAPAQLADLPRRSRHEQPAGLPPEMPLRSLLGWVALGDGQLDPISLSTASRVPEWEVRLLVDELTIRGLVDLHDGRVVPGPGAEAALGAWQDATLVDAHARIAAVLPRGSRHRFRHLIQAGDVVEAEREVRVAADELFRRGSFAAACALFRTMDRASREAGRERAWLEDWILAAVHSDDIHERLQALEASSRYAGKGAYPYRERLARASVALGLRRFDEAAVQLGDLPELSDERMELARASLLVEARTKGRSDASAEVARWEAWASASPERAGRWAAWAGIIAYDQGAFERSADCHRRSAELRSDAYGRVVSQLNLASALLEIPRPTEAREAAHRATASARTMRHPSLEMRGWTILRNLEYRDGLDRVDEELVEAADALGLHPAAGPLLLVEAASAWRLGDLPVAGEILSKATRAYAGHRAAAAILLAFSAALGGRVVDADAVLAGLSEGRLRAQAVGLLRLAGHRTIPLTAADEASLAALPSNRRLEILSPAEIHSA